MTITEAREILSNRKDLKGYDVTSIDKNTNDDEIVFNVVKKNKCYYGLLDLVNDILDLEYAGTLQELGY